MSSATLRVAYADPPYPGQSAKHYANHPDYAGEVDHSLLLQSLEYDYDGFCLHTSSTALVELLALADRVMARPDKVRVMAWVKPFAAFKVNVPVAYAWEPVLVKEARKPVVKPGMTYRDFVSEPITMKRGLSGAKPERVCRWLFEVMGCEPDDELVDLFPGTGAVLQAWGRWRAELPLPVGRTSPDVTRRATRGRVEGMSATFDPERDCSNCGEDMQGMDTCQNPMCEESEDYEPEDALASGIEEAWAAEEKP